VIIMGLVSGFAFICNMAHLGSLDGMTDSTKDNYLAAVPVVALFAPVGILLAARLPSKIMVWFVCLASVFGVSEAVVLSCCSCCAVCGRLLLCCGWISSLVSPVPWLSSPSTVADSRLVFTLFTPPTSPLAWSIGSLRLRLSLPDQPLACAMSLVWIHAVHPRFGVVDVSVRCGDADAVHRIFPLACLFISAWPFASSVGYYHK